MARSNNRLLITGASGFLGSHVVAEAIKEGAEVTVISRRSIAGFRGTQVQLDLVEGIVPSTLFKAVDCVIHVAGLTHQPSGLATREDFYRTNVEMTGKVAAAAKNQGAKRFLLVSSTSVYGEHPAPVDEGTQCRPATDYAWSKHQGELAAAKILAGSNTELVILRSAALFGPDDPGNVARLARAIGSGRFVVPGNGNNVKSLSPVGITATAIMALATKKRYTTASGNLIFNGPCQRYQLRQIVEAMARASNRTVPLSLPASLLFPAVFALKFLGRFSRSIRTLSIKLGVLLRNDAYLDAKIRAEIVLPQAGPLEEYFREFYFQQTGNRVNRPRV